MTAASSDPIVESLQRLQPELDAFNNSLSELCRANGNKPETLALRNGLQEYYSKLHKDLLSRYEILKPKEKNQNAVEKVPKIESEVKQTRKKDEETKEEAEEKKRRRKEKKMNNRKMKQTRKEDEEKKGEDNFGGYSIPKILPIIVRRRVFAFCKGLNGKGLLTYLINNSKDHVKLRDQLPAALGMVSNGAQAVLNAIKGYDFSESGSRLNDEKESINRRTCISLLECLFPVLGSNENAPVAKDVQEGAREMARAWRENMGLEKSLESASKLDVQAFLQLLVTFRIGKDFEQDELCEMLLQIVSLRESPALALFLGLSPKMPDFVDKLSKNGKWIEAIRYAHAFGIMDERKPADLLKAYLEDTKKAVEDMVKKGGGVLSCLLNSTIREIDAINTVIKVVKEYNLEHMFPLGDLQKKLTRLQIVKDMRTGTIEHKISKNQRNKVNKESAASTPGKKMMVTILEEKKAADAKSDKKGDAIGKERLKRPRSSEPLRGNKELFGTQGPADLGLYRLSQRVKYDSEREMKSTAGDEEKVPHNAGLFQNNHGIYRDDRNLPSYHGDGRSTLRPSVYGSGHPGTFVTPSPTVTQTNHRRGSDGYPSASGYSNINPVGSSFYGTRAMAGALLVSSAQIDFDGRGLRSYTPTFGGVDKSSLGSSTFDIGAVANSSGSQLKNDYRRGPESNISTLCGDNLSNVSSSMYDSNWSSDPNNWNGRRGLDQYMLKLGASNKPSSNSSVYASGASAVPSSNVYGSGLERQNSGFASTPPNYGSMASAAGVSGRSAINRYQFNSGLRF